MRDLEFAFDPACPFSWLTSRWVEEVRAPRHLRVTWRPISLWYLNEGQEQDTPMARAHQRGLRLQRVVVAAAEAEGDEVIGPLYTAFGSAIWDAAPPEATSFESVLESVAGNGPDVEAVLSNLGLSTEFAEAQQDTALDEILRRSTDRALEQAGGDVGTPMLRFGSDGDRPAYSGPVLLAPVRGEEAVELWDAVATLVGSGAFAELKTNRRPSPEVRLMANVAA